MERLTKRLADGTAYTGALINASIKGVTYPTYIGKAADKLAEYEDAEEQGLLLRLPCKPNSEVFLICSRYTHCSFEDVPFEESSCEGCEHGCDSRKELYIHRNESVGIEWIARNLNKFGKTVFLTREEAESKLKEMEGQR